MQIDRSKVCLILSLALVNLLTTTTDIVMGSPFMEEAQLDCRQLASREARQFCRDIITEYHNLLSSARITRSPGLIGDLKGESYYTSDLQNLLSKSPVDGAIDSSGSRAIVAPGLYDDYGASNSRFQPMRGKRNNPGSPETAE